MFERIRPVCGLTVNKVCTFFCLAVAVSCVAPVSAEPDLIIRNATLIDPAGSVDDRKVNLVFDHGLLILITEDDAAVAGAQVLDASGGVLIGDLALNKTPSLLILDSDPREQFSVLMDTREHTVFAMEDGQVRVNQLGSIESIDPVSEPQSWLAYTPPPFAVPLAYHNDSAFNRFDTRYVNGLVSGALAVDRTEWLTQSAGNREIFGDLDEFSGGEIRALRFGVAGTIKFEKPWVYVLAGATNAFDKGFELEGQDDFTFFDWRLDIPAPGDTTISVGKQKEPISMERLTGMVFLPWQERSVASDALFPGRNVGVVWSGSRPSQKTTWAAGVFNDWLDTDASFDESAKQFVGRVTWAPSLAGDESNVLHLGVGYRYSDAKEGQRYRSEPEINKAPVYVDTGRGLETGLYEADSAELYNFEAAWRAGPLWLSSEYFVVNSDAEAVQNPSYDGYYVSAAWSLTGEMRPYDYRRGLFKRMPVAQSVYQGGSGAVEAAVRFSSIDLNDGLINGGSTDVASVGVNWWLTPVIQIGANYRYIWNTTDGIDGTSSGFTTRILLMLE